MDIGLSDGNHRSEMSASHPDLTRWQLAQDLAATSTRRRGGRMSRLLVQGVFEGDSTTHLQAPAGMLNAAEEPGIAFESVLEPLIL